MIHFHYFSSNINKTTMQNHIESKTHINKLTQPSQQKHKKIQTLTIKIPKSLRLDYLNDPFQRPETRTRTRKPISARMNTLELINIELLVDDPNREIDTIGRRQIDPDLIDVEPKEESLDLNALEVGDRAVAEFSGDLGLVVDQVLELDVAGLVQNDDESAVVG